MRRYRYLPRTRRILRPVGTQVRTHADCVNFVPPDYCRKKDIRVPPEGRACKDFVPAYRRERQKPEHTPLSSLGQEKRALELEREKLRKRLEEIEKKLEKIGR